MSTGRGQKTAQTLLKQVICPHCWSEFPPEEILWVAAHSDLTGDPLLGSDAQQRFLPTRFNVQGKALDIKGVPCSKLACPQCHLLIPRQLLEMEPFFISILGAPGSGKSYFLAAMTWKLRSILSSQFGLSFGDADPEANQLLINYEEELFLNSDDDKLVALRKTELEGGELYETVNYGSGRTVQYPKPFVFPIQPEAGHQYGAHSRRLARALCLYDNAGEHFLPGNENANRPVQHLAVSRVLLFLFDPTQHPKFRNACKDQSQDPQILKNVWSNRQDLIFQEAANRIRNYKGLPAHEKDDRPLVVVVTKYDAWCSLASGKPLKEEWVTSATQSAYQGLNLKQLRNISRQVREIVSKYAPEMVSAVEGFSSDVIYIPASAQGQAPELIEESGYLGIRPRDIKSMWIEIPMLYALHRSVPGLIATVKNGEQKKKVSSSTMQKTSDKDHSSSPS